MRLELDLDFASRFAPTEFFFGVANAPYLCEGGFNTPGGPANNYGVLEANGRIEKSGQTTRFWADPEPHVSLAAALGLNAFRMGLDWARIQPSSSLEPHDPPAWDEEALDHYADTVAMVVDKGMQPIITLHHFTHPAWVGEPFWLSDHGPDLLVEYEIRVVEEVNRRLASRGSDLMRHFLISNEPNQIALMLHFGDLFPGPQGMDTLLPSMDNLLSRYIRIYDGLYDLFERLGWGEPHLGFTLGSQAPYEIDRQMSDVLRLRTWGVPREGVATAMAGYRDRWAGRIGDLARSQLSSAQFARYEERIATFAAALPPTSLTKTLDALYASPRTKKLDYLSLNVYDPIGFARAEPDAPKGEIRWDEFTMDADVYRTYIHATNDGNTDLPVYMGENSCANLQEIGGIAKPRPDGWTRERFLKTYLMEMVRCMKEGVPIRGYLYWSLVDDFEWQAGTPPRLGLYNYDYEHHRIQPTDGFGEPSGEIYGNLVAALRSGRQETIQQAFMYTHASGRGA
jgi:beta-glucosidase/6-phospho-beta-glucosidase/beta-galactosidase